MKRSVSPLNKLTEHFERLPGIGHKSAQRIAFHILGMSDEQAESFAEAIVNAKRTIHRCSVCCDLTDAEICPVCSDEGRDRSLICVVESPKDVIAVEKTGDYKGLFHVLHGAISPLNNIGPEDLSVKELIARLSDGEIKEVIMTTNPTVEGEATAVFLSRLIKPLGIEVSRLAYGVPVGADIEYADEVTLSRAIEGRKII